MITRSALQVLTDALKLIGELAGHEVPTAAEEQDGSARLAELIDSWGTHAQTMYRSRRDVIPLLSGQATYTIGPDEEVDLPRPMGIDAASVLTTGDPASEVPVRVLTDQEYTALPVKALTGALVQGLVFSATPTATLWVTPEPTAAQDLVIYWREPLQQFPDLVTQVALNPGYAKALRTNLAVELAPEFGRVIDPLLDRLARESLADVKRANVQIMELFLDPALTGCGPGYNILSDT